MTAQSSQAVFQEFLPGGSLDHIDTPFSADLVDELAEILIPHITDDHIDLITFLRQIDEHQREIAQVRGYGDDPLA